MPAVPSACLTVKLGCPTVPSAPTVVFNASANGLICSTFTASVSAVPLATLAILLPPLFKPDLVRDTGLSPLAMFNPLPFNTLSPAVTCGVFSPSVVRTLLPALSLSALTVWTVISSFNLTLMPSAPASVTTFWSSPLRLTVSPSLATSVVPLLPANATPLLSTAVFASTPF